MKTIHDILFENNSDKIESEVNRWVNYIVLRNNQTSKNSLESVIRSLKKEHQKTKRFTSSETNAVIDELTKIFEKIVTRKVKQLTSVAKHWPADKLKSEFMTSKDLTTLGIKKVIDKFNKKYPKK